MNERLHVVISGRVQGVGYRYAAYREALRVGARGWIKNLPDGRVEGLFEGPAPVLQQLLDWCRRGPPAATVSAVEPEWSVCDTPFDTFTIR